MDEFNGWYGQSKGSVKLPKKKRSQPERENQILALDLLRIHYPEIEDSCIHIANERKTSHQYGKILKRMGVKPGVSDLFFLEPKGVHHGLWIEVKAPNGNKPSKEQEAFLRKVIAKGYAGMVAYGAQEILDIVCAYFDVPFIKVPD